MCDQLVHFTPEDILSEDFMRELMPSLSFGDAGVAETHLPEAQARPSLPRPSPGDPCAASPVPHFRAALIQRGFVRQTARETWGDAVPGALLSALSVGLTSLAERGLPLSLVSMSREAQAVARALKRVVTSGLSIEHAAIGDWAFFHVDAGRGGKGWPPHRDRARVDGALDSDGSPNYVTCWLPLSSASPYSSCLYMVPRAHDPGYEAGDMPDPASHDDSAGGEGGAYGGGSGALDRDHPLTRAFASPASWQHIVALPTGRGGLVCFSSRTLHWGSLPLEALEDAGEPARAPRQALSIAFATAAFEHPALARGGACEAPTFTEAAALAAAQALIYHDQAPLSAPHARAFLGVLQGRAGGLLDPGYRARAVKAGDWACFTQGLVSALGPQGPPSAAAVSLAFAALAAAEAGFATADYVS